MSENSKIEWTDTTWNPVTGCTKISAGCKNCYAEREWARLSGNSKTVYHGRKFTDVQCHEERLEDPLRWRKPRRVFVNSMSDLFHQDVPDEFIMAVFTTMAIAKRHTFQILTKRSKRMLEITCRWNHDGLRNIHGRALPLSNVWMGVSIESASYLERLEHLRRTHAATKFVSFEPLLGDVGHLDLAGIHWVIVGGESGPEARPMHPGWVRSIRDQCQAAGVPFFLKQWGEWSAFNTGTYHIGTIAPDGWWSEGEPAGCGRDHRGAKTVWKVGKKAAGRLLDGRTWEEMPA